MPDSPRKPRGVPPPARLPEFWSNTRPAQITCVGELFGDDRHWIGGQTRRHREDRCAGCMAAIPIGWYAYVHALVSYRDSSNNSIVDEVRVWDLPRGNADDVAGELRGVTFNVRKSPAGSPKKLAIARLDRPLRTDLPQPLDLDVYLDQRERRAKPIQPIPGIDETTAEAIRRYQDALQSIDAASRQPTLLDFVPPNPQAPKTAPIANPSSSDAETMRAMLREILRRTNPGGQS